MNPELSRRVAKVMHSKVISVLSGKDRIALANAVDDANSLDDLPDNYKQMILQAEGARTAKVRYKGSSKSGNYGHAGIPGHQGGSAPKSNSAEPSEKDIELPSIKFSGTQGEVSARARERVKIMEDTFPGTKFSDFTPNQLGLQESKKRGEPGVSLPQAIYDRTAQHLPAVSDNDKVQAVIQEFKKWAVQPIPYVNTNALKFGTGLPYQEVFGVLNHLRSQDASSVSVSVDRLGKPTHVRLNQ